MTRIHDHVTWGAIAGNRTAISVYIYGTDVTRLGSSVRRDYDLPVLPARAAA